MSANKMPRNCGAFFLSRKIVTPWSILVFPGMARMRLLLVFRIEFVVEVYEIVVEVIVEIVVLVVEIIVVQLFIIEVFVLVVEFVVVGGAPLVLDIIIVFQIVLEILVLGVIFWCRLRQPRFSFPAVRETPRGLQHGAHYRNLLVIRPKRARASPRVTASFYRSH